MNTSIVLASNNDSKLSEIAAVMPSNIRLITLAQAGIADDIEETGTTFKENALIKAQFVHNKTGLNCLSDDSGLIIPAIDNEPGVYSARYAGLPPNNSKNIQLVLSRLQGKANRMAMFHTTIALILNGEKYFFEGNIAGTITQECIGDNGFGYDPIFIPNGYNITFAQMSAHQKNSISHRAVAMRQLVQFLLTLENH